MQVTQLVLRLTMGAEKQGWDDSREHSEISGQDFLQLDLNNVRFNHWK